MKSIGIGHSLIFGPGERDSLDVKPGALIPSLSNETPAAALSHVVDKGAKFLL